MHYTLTQRILWFIYWLFLTVSFCIIGFLLVAQATGYRYNNHNHRWQKTGMLIVTSNQRDNQLHFDNRTITLNKTNRIPNILPGTYQLMITKEHYTPWQETVSIPPGFVVTYDRVSLFLEQPVELPVTDQYLTTLANSLPDPDITLVNGELWYQTSLVSRFSTTPTAAILLPDGNHFIYVIENEIRVIERNGHNDQLLYTRTARDETQLALDGDTILLFTDGPNTKAIQFR